MNILNDRLENAQMVSLVVSQILIHRMFHKSILITNRIDHGYLVKLAHTINTIRRELISIVTTESVCVSYSFLLQYIHVVCRYLSRR
jgi:hypothetical protein